MAKYVDLEIIHNAKIDKITQASISVGSTIDGNTTLAGPEVVIIPSVLGNTTTGSTQKRVRYSHTDSKWYYNNGSGDLAIGSLPSTEAITFTASDLTNGILTITHNFNKQYILDFRCSVQPRTVTFNNNTIVLDYSDQPSTFTGGTVYFTGALQSMISAS